MTTSRIRWATLAVIYAAFYFWYGGSGGARRDVRLLLHTRNQRGKRRPAGAVHLVVRVGRIDERADDAEVGQFIGTRVAIANSVQALAHVLRFVLIDFAAECEGL